MKNSPKFHLSNRNRSIHQDRLYPFFHSLKLKEIQAAMETLVFAYVYERAVFRTHECLSKCLLFIVFGSILFSRRKNKLPFGIGQKASRMASLSFQLSSILGVREEKISEGKGRQRVTDDSAIRDEPFGSQSRSILKPIRKLVHFTFHLKYYNNAKKDFSICSKSICTKL